MKVAEYFEKMPEGLAGLLFQEMSIWSNDACYGYCIEALERAGFDRETIMRVRSCLHDAFEELTVEEAERKWVQW